MRALLLTLLALAAAAGAVEDGKRIQSLEKELQHMRRALRELQADLRAVVSAARPASPAGAAPAGRRLEGDEDADILVWLETDAGALRIGGDEATAATVARGGAGRVLVSDELEATSLLAAPRVLAEQVNATSALFARRSVLDRTTVLAGDAVAVPASHSHVEVLDDDAPASNAVSLAAGVEGQLLLVVNSDAQDLSGDVTVPAGATRQYVYNGGQGWLEVSSSLGELTGVDSVASDTSLALDGPEGVMVHADAGPVVLDANAGKAVVRVAGNNVLTAHSHELVLGSAEGAVSVGARNLTLPAEVGVAGSELTVAVPGGDLALAAGSVALDADNVTISHRLQLAAGRVEADADLQLDGGRAPNGWTAGGNVLVQGGSGFENDGVSQGGSVVLRSGTSGSGVRSMIRLRAGDTASSGTYGDIEISAAGACAYTSTADDDDDYGDDDVSGCAEYSTPGGGDDDYGGDDGYGGDDDYNGDDDGYGGKGPGRVIIASESNRADAIFLNGNIKLGTGNVDVAGSLTLNAIHSYDNSDGGWTAGDITLTAGNGDSGSGAADGGMVQLKAGQWEKEVPPVLRLKSGSQEGDGTAGDVQIHAGRHPEPGDDEYGDDDYSPAQSDTAPGKIELVSSSTAADAILLDGNVKLATGAIVGDGGVSLSGGDALNVSYTGGAVSIAGGDGADGSRGGGVSILSGKSSDEHAAGITLSAGVTTGSGTMGDIEIVAGGAYVADDDYGGGGGADDDDAADDDDGGDDYGGDDGYGGDDDGYGDYGDPGKITIKSENPDDDAIKLDGKVMLQHGRVTAGSTLKLFAVNAEDNYNGVAGDIKLTAGEGSSGSGSARGGEVLLRAGQSNGETVPRVRLIAGKHEDGTAGDVQIHAGEPAQADDDYGGSTVTPGKIELWSANTAADAILLDGNVKVATGAIVGDGGMSLSGGDALNGSYTGGAVTVKGGDGADDTEGGAVSILAGQSSGGSGQVAGITLTAGTTTGSGTLGDIAIVAAGTDAASDDDYDDDDDGYNDDAIDDDDYGGVDDDDGYGGGDDYGGDDYGGGGSPGKVLIKSESDDDDAIKLDGNVRVKYGKITSGRSISLFAIDAEDSTNYEAGHVRLFAGDGSSGSGTPKGGKVVMRAGSSNGEEGAMMRLNPGAHQDGTAGNVEIRAGKLPEVDDDYGGSTVTPGKVEIWSANTAADAILLDGNVQLATGAIAGDSETGVALSGGDAFNGSYTGGAVTVKGGDGADDTDGGDVSILAGKSGGEDYVASITLTAGVTTGSGTMGDVEIVAGGTYVADDDYGGGAYDDDDQGTGDDDGGGYDDDDYNSVARGKITIKSDNGDDDAIKLDGRVMLQTGRLRAGSTLRLNAGNAEDNYNGVAGDVKLTAGAGSSGSGSARGGEVLLRAGQSDAEAAPRVRLISGMHEDGTAGDVQIHAGEPPQADDDYGGGGTVTPGKIELWSANTAADAILLDGNVKVATGAIAGDSEMGLAVTGGDALNASYTGGTVTVAGGNGADSASEGGGVVITAGQSTSETAASIVLTPGGVGSGSMGDIMIAAGGAEASDDDYGAGDDGDDYGGGPTQGKIHVLSENGDPDAIWLDGNVMLSTLTSEGDLYVATEAGDIVVDANNGGGGEVAIRNEGADRLRANDTLVSLFGGVLDVSAAEVVARQPLSVESVTGSSGAELALAPDVSLTAAASAAVTIRSGDASASAAGAVTLQGGHGQEDGGSVQLLSGPSAAAFSGDIVLSTSGTASMGSGNITLQTGAPTGGGNSGDIVLSTSAPPAGGTAGSVSLVVGASNGGTDGGDVVLSAGDSSALSKAGGSVRVSGGHGSAFSFGKGGPVEVAGGIGKGATGGSLTLRSGAGTQYSSGDVRIYTPDAGASGVSGQLTLSTGTATLGNSGSVLIATGEAGDGHGGDITLSAGQGGPSSAGGSLWLSAGGGKGATEGGSITVQAGSSTGSGGGGSLSLVAGSSGSGSAGTLTLSSATEIALDGPATVSDDVTLSSGGLLSASGVALDLQGASGATLRAASGAVSLSSADGAVLLTAGDAASGAAVDITAGAATGSGSGHGGTVTISGGDAGGSGDGGGVVLTTGFGSVYGKLTLSTFNSAADAILLDSAGVTVSGALTLGSLAAPEGAALAVAAGSASSGSAGALTLSAGHASSGSGGTGGTVAVSGGRANLHAGGQLELTSGASDQTSSGDVTLQSPDAGASGVSGVLTIRSGQSYDGNSGSLTLSTGAAGKGRGGAITLSVGSSASGDGGAVDITAGSTTAGFTGGALSLAAGEGKLGGGVLSLAAGTGSSSGTGGAVDIRSGGSAAGTSGELVMWTANAGSIGTSGALFLSTGATTSGNSGSVTIASGMSTGSGRSGDVTISSGTGAGGWDAGLVTLAGGTGASAGAAGSVDIRGGTHPANGDGGSVLLEAGSSVSGTAGGITLSTPSTAPGAISLEAPVSVTDRLTTQGLWHSDVVAVNMDGALHTLKVDSAGDAETLLVGNIVLVDPAGGDGISLLLPAVSDFTGALWLVNIAGGGGSNDVNVMDDSNGAQFATLGTNSKVMCVCDGSSWACY